MYREKDRRRTKEEVQPGRTEERARESKHARESDFGGGSRVHETTKSEGILILNKEMIIDHNHFKLMGEAPGRPEEANLTHGGGQIGVGRAKGGIESYKEKGGKSATLEERIL